MLTREHKGTCFLVIFSQFLLGGVPPWVFRGESGRNDPEIRGPGLQKSVPVVDAQFGLNTTAKIPFGPSNSLQSDLEDVIYSQLPSNLCTC